jgi:regulator of nonsense transcripts 2
MKQSMGHDSKEPNLKDIDSLTLEKYLEEIAAACIEGAGRCKTEKDVWSAVEVS